MFSLRSCRMSTKQKIVSCLTFIIIIINLLYRLPTQAIVEWDEARHIASAIEMLNNHNFLINSYQNLPDYWNAKPILSFWGAAMGYSLYGDIVGLRLFSLISAMLVCMLTFIYGKNLAGIWCGLLAILLLITTPKLLHFHGARTADSDMLFILWICIAFFCLAYVRRHSYVLAYIVLGMAFLTKSFHAVPFAIAAFFYTIYVYKNLKTSFWPVFYAPFFFWLPVLIWGLLRYTADGTQFFETMIFYDLLKRSTSTIEGHYAPLGFYVYFLLKTYSLFLFVSLYFLFKKFSFILMKQPQVILLLLWTFIPLFLYSTASSKLVWYIYPIMPSLVILLSLIIVKYTPLLTPLRQRMVIFIITIMLIFNETTLINRIIKNERETDRVIIAINQISQIDTHKKLLFLADSPQNVRQHYYASALVAKNITIENGGEPAFNASTITPRFLIDNNGNIQKVIK